MGRTDEDCFQPGPGGAARKPVEDSIIPLREGDRGLCGNFRPDSSQLQPAAASSSQLQPARDRFREEVGMMKAGKMEAWLCWSLEAEEVKYRCQMVGVQREKHGHQRKPQTGIQEMSR